MPIMSSIIVFLSSKSIFSHTFVNCVPRASSIMMYSAPTGLSVVALQAKTFGTGMSRTDRTYRAINVDS